MRGSGPALENLGQDSNVRQSEAKGKVQLERSLKQTVFAKSHRFPTQIQALESHEKCHERTGGPQVSTGRQLAADTTPQQTWGPFMKKPQAEPQTWAGIPTGSQNCVAARLLVTPPLPASELEQLHLLACLPCGATGQAQRPPRWFIAAPDR